MPCNTRFCRPCYIWLRIWPASKNIAVQWSNLTICEGPFSICQKSHSSDGWSRNNRGHQLAVKPHKWQSAVVKESLHSKFHSQGAFSLSKREDPSLTAWVSELLFVQLDKKRFPSSCSTSTGAPAGLHPPTPHTLWSKPHEQHTLLYLRNEDFNI